MNLVRDRWMFVPIIFLGGSVAVGVTTVCLAVVGRPIGAEPEYYNKAAAWDEHRAQSAANDLIGWKVSSQIAPGEDGLPWLTVGITDKYAYAIDPESVEVEAIPIANADLRESLPMVRAAAGQFRAALHARVPGQWEFRVRARLGTVVYTDTFRQTLHFAKGGKP